MLRIIILTFLKSDISNYNTINATKNNELIKNRLVI